MRERLARLFAVALVLSVTGLAALFAQRQNAGRGLPPVEPSGEGAAPRVPPPDVPPDAAALSRGRQSFVDLGCLRCHRVAGEGSPRSVLDGVGERLFPDEIRAWIIADPSTASLLPASAVRAKSEYRALSADDMDALVAYLSALRAGR